MAIPISLLISHAPEVVSAATRIWNTWKGRTTPPAAGKEADEETRLAAMAARLQALEEGAEAQAKLMKDLAEQTAALTGALSVASKRTTVALALAGAALAVALVAAGMVIMR